MGLEYQIFATVAVIYVGVSLLIDDLETMASGRCFWGTVFSICAGAWVISTITFLFKVW